MLSNSLFYQEGCLNENIHLSTIGDHTRDHGTLQEVVEVALSECCGSCAGDVKHILHGSQQQLMGRKAYNESDVRFPVFMQGEGLSFES